jgi:hypothetical protein
LSVVRFELKLTLLADVGEVRRDGAALSPPAGHLHHDLWYPPHGAPDLLNLGDRKSPL